MKRFWLKLAIFVLDKLEEKINIDFDNNEINDLTQAKMILQDKLDALNKK